MKIQVQLLFLVLMIFGFFACSQERLSPPAEEKSVLGQTNITINYSQPSVKGRTIWGELVPYNEVWRTGANEATTFEIDKPVLIEGQKLEVGKYALFTIPGEKEWTVIFNKVAKQWGAYDYEKDKDQLRVNVSPQDASELVEKMTFSIEDDGVVTLAWDTLKVSFKVEEDKA